MISRPASRREGRAPSWHPTRLAWSALRVTVAATVLALGAAPAAAQVKATFLYSLSNFGGKLPYDWGRVYVDDARDETYVISQSLIRIFNASGMETFSFGDDLDLGQIVDMVVDDRGDIILLSYKDNRPLLTRCNFRGVPTGAMVVTGLPDTVGFGPNRLVARNGLLYFAATSTGRVIVTDASGVYREHVDLLANLNDLDEKQRKSELEVFGFTVDGEGNMFFTVPVLFKAYKLAPDKTLTAFGRPGSAAGRFGVVSGIATDTHGQVFVSDKLRSVVMVFDREFRFLYEFGYRGVKPENLVVPDDLVIDKRDRLYVTQGRRRGISVFALSGA